MSASRAKASKSAPGSGNGKIPADFLLDGTVLRHLPGLLTVLRDGGFSEQEVFDWLFREDDSLPRPVRSRLSAIHQSAADLRRHLERQAAFLVDVTSTDARRRLSE